jgi:hypothetical protein
MSSAGFDIHAKLVPFVAEANAAKRGDMRAVAGAG